jgi:glycosyltransferase 2 family protein
VPAKFPRVNARAVVASIVLVAASVWALSAGGLPLLPEASSLRRLTFLDYAVFSGALLTTALTRFARWYFLLAPIARVPFRKVMSIGAIGMAMVFFLPMRLGELARPALLREKGRLSAWAVTGTVGAERIVDGVVFSILLLGGLWLAKPLEPLPDHVGNLAVPTSLVPQAARLAGAMFATAFVVMAAFYAFRSLARRVTEALLGVFSLKLAKKVADAVERLSDGFRILVHGRYTIAYLSLTLTSIGMQVVAVQTLGTALGMEELTFARSAVVLGVLALGFAAPNAPGFFGTAQLAFYAGLAIYVAPDKVPREGSTLVFLFYTTNLLIIIVAAGIALAAEVRAKRGQEAGGE